MPQRPRPAPAMCTASVFLPGRKTCSVSSQASLPLVWLKRCRQGVQPPHISTASQAMSRAAPALPFSIAVDAQRLHPQPAGGAGDGAAEQGLDAEGTGAVGERGVDRRADVDDGGGLGAGLGEVEGGVPGAVVRGDDRRAVADLDAVAVEVGLGGAGQHDAGAVVAVEDQRLLERALGEHDLARRAPSTSARAGRRPGRWRGGRSGAGRGRRGSGGSSRSPSSAVITVTFGRAASSARVGGEPVPGGLAVDDDRRARRAACRRARRSRRRA